MENETILCFFTFLPPTPLLKMYQMWFQNRGMTYVLLLISVILLCYIYFNHHYYFHYWLSLWLSLPASLLPLLSFSFLPVILSPPTLLSFSFLPRLLLPLNHNSSRQMKGQIWIIQWIKKLMLHSFGGSIVLSTLKHIDRQLVSFKYLCIEYHRECERPCPQQSQPPSCTAFFSPYLFASLLKHSLGFHPTCQLTHFHWSLLY